MNSEVVGAIGKIVHTYLYVLHDGEVVHRNTAAKMVAEELGIIDDSTSAEHVERAQTKLIPFLDVLLESGLLISRPQKSVMISPKGLEALIDHEGTFSKQFLESSIPQALAIEF